MRTSEDESPGRGMSLAARRLLAIAAYYVTSAVLLLLAWTRFPLLRALFAGSHPTELTSGSLPATSPLPSAGVSLAAGGVGVAVASTLLVLTGALATALPLAWVYSLTRQRRGFSQSMVHILVLLPLAVAGMVLLIQNSLALAFSLAGIVAVLRFRNSLDDVKDGVYIFVAVSIGISASLGALLVGVLTSAVFSASVLMLWWLDFARTPLPGGRSGLRRLARLPKVTSAEKGKREAPTTESGDEVFAAAARAWRRQLHLTAEQQVATGKRRFNAALRIQSSDGQAGRASLEQVLRERTDRWELHGIVPRDQGGTTLTYRVRIRRSARGELVDALQAASHTVGVEIR